MSYLIDHLGEILIVVGYLLPSLVAWKRRHRQQLAINVLNILLGWTVIGWIGALIWACTMDVNEPKSKLNIERDQFQPFNPWQRLINNKDRNRA